MSYKTLSGLNSSDGIHTIFVYVNDITGGLFVNMLLFTLFIIVMFGSYFSQKRLDGKADFPVSMAVAGYVTTVIALVLSVIDGMVSVYTLITVIVISALATLFLLFSKTTSVN